MLYVFVCPDVLLSAILIVRCVMSLLYSSGSLYSYVMPTPRPHLSMNYLYSVLISSDPTAVGVGGSVIP